MALDKDKVMASAQKLIQQNKLDKAIKELRRIVDEDPKDVRVLQKLGDVHAKLGERAEAAKAYGAVAQFFTEQGFYLKAVAIYKTILRVDPNIIEVNIKLAELYHQLGLMTDCVAQYQVVANALDRAGKTRESLAIIKKMVDLDAENVASRIKLAELYSAQGQAVDAVREFDQAAQQLKQQDRMDDWGKVAERLLFHDPNRVDLSREMAAFYLQRGDAKRALAKLQVCFKANNRDVETLKLLSRAFREMDQLPKSISVLRELARVHQESGQAAEAESTWRQVLSLNPQDEEAQRALGLAVAPPQQDYVRHEPSFVGAFPVAPPPAAAPVVAAPPPPPPPPPPAPPPAHLQPRAATGLGALQGKPQTAQDQVTKLLAETDVYVKYGLRDKALAHVRKVFDIDPDNLDAHEKLKGLLIKAGDIAGAADEVIACFRISMGRDDRQRARKYLSDLASIQSTHPAIATMREELDGVPSTAPLAINVLRRQGAQAPAPPPAAAPDEDEVALVVDPDAPDEAVALEVASGVVDIGDVELDGALDEALPGEAAGPGEVGGNLMDEGVELGSDPPPSSDMPTMGAEADDFGDFMGGAQDAAPEAAENPSGEAVSLDSGDLALDADMPPGGPLDQDMPPADDFLVVPSSDGGESPAMKTDEPFLDAPPQDEDLAAADDGSGFGLDSGGDLAATPDDPFATGSSLEGVLDAAPLDAAADGATTDFAADAAGFGDDPGFHTQAMDNRAFLNALSPPVPPPEEPSPADDLLGSDLDGAGYDGAGLDAAPLEEPPPDDGGASTAPVDSWDDPPPAESPDNTLDEPMPAADPFAAEPLAADGASDFAADGASDFAADSAGDFGQVPVSGFADDGTGDAAAADPGASDFAASDYGASDLGGELPPMDGAEPPAPEATEFASSSSDAPPQDTSWDEPGDAPASLEAEAPQDAEQPPYEEPPAEAPADDVAAAPAAEEAPPPAEEEEDVAEQFFPDELAEAKFFVEQGLYDEAREVLGRILEEVESRKAAHLLATVDALERGEEPPPWPPVAAPPPAAEAPPPPAEDDSAFDLARELEGDLGDLGPASGMSVEPTEQVSVEAVLAEFKKGVDKVVAQDDADTHHDLGIAYKEMGLLEDAVGEFQRSCRSPAKEADAYYMMGICRAEQGMTAEAVESWRRALQAARVAPHQQAAINYELGNALEQEGDRAGALAAFSAAAAVDAAFKDVRARMEKLSAAAAPRGGAGKGKNIGYI